MIFSIFTIDVKQRILSPQNQLLFEYNFTAKIHGVMFLVLEQVFPTSFRFSLFFLCHFTH
jgi:hypothetical protein